jgi:hypothetical protein
MFVRQAPNVKPRQKAKRKGARKNCKLNIDPEILVDKGLKAETRRKCSRILARIRATGKLTVAHSGLAF